MSRLVFQSITGPVRRLLPAAALAAGLIGGAPPAVAAEPPATATAGARVPALELRDLNQDGGTVEQGTVVKYRFTLANRGQTDLQITQVKPSCGCTAPHWDKVIPAGKEGIIEAEVNTTHFRGPISKYLTVTTNDPARAELRLTLTAKVTPLIEVAPGLNAFISVEDQPVRQEFTLERTGGKAMQIKQVVTNGPYLKAETTPLPGEGRYKLTLTAGADAPMGRSTVPVVVQTDLEKSPNLTLIVQVERGIVTMPPMLFWSLTGGAVQMPIKGAVTISRKQGGFHVTGVKVDDEKLEAKLVTVRDGREYRVFVTYNGGWEGGEGGMVKKTLTITTDDPKQPELTVPVQAVLPQPPKAPAAAAAP